MADKCPFKEQECTDDCALYSDNACVFRNIETHLNEMKECSSKFQSDLLEHLQDRAKYGS